MSEYTITTVKGSRTVDTIGNALRAAAEMCRELQSAFGPSITRDNTDETVSFDFVTECDSISVDNAQDLLRLAGVDPREDDADGFHWPYAPSVSEVADALDRWTCR